MDVAIPALDLLGLLVFCTVVGLVLTIPTESPSHVSPAAKLCMLVAMSVYVFASFSNVLEHANATAALDPLEDYVEVLFPPFVLYTAWSLSVRQRENELMRSQRAALRSQEMMLGIMDAAPAGIMLVDLAGGITFANETAKQVLDLVEVDASPHIASPGWSVRCADGSQSTDFACLLEPARGAHEVTVSWDSGWRVELQVRTEPLHEASGRVGGVVATFPPPAPRP